MIFPAVEVVENIMEAVAWADWSATITSGSGTLTDTTVNVAKWRKIGNVAEFIVDVTVDDIGTGGGDLRISTPVTGLVSGCAGRNATNGNIVQGIVTGNLIIAWTKNNLMPVANGQRMTLRGRFEIV